MKDRSKECKAIINLQVLLLLGKTTQRLHRTQWLHRTANTHHVFQDQLLRGGPVSVLGTKMKEFCSALQVFFISAKAEPQGCFAVPHEPQIKRIWLEILAVPPSLSSPQTLSLWKAGVLTIFDFCFPRP